MNEPKHDPIEVLKRARVISEAKADYITKALVDAGYTGSLRANVRILADHIVEQADAGLCKDEGCSIAGPHVCINSDFSKLEERVIANLIGQMNTDFNALRTGRVKLHNLPLTLAQRKAQDQFLSDMGMKGFKETCGEIDIPVGTYVRVTVPVTIRPEKGAGKTKVIGRMVSRDDMGLCYDVVKIRSTDGGWMVTTPTSFPYFFDEDLWTFEIYPVEEEPAPANKQMEFYSACAKANPEAFQQPANDNKGVRLYVVKKGDTLYGIAEEAYGNGELWPLIFCANLSQMNDANKLYPDQELQIPVVPRLEPVQVAKPAPLRGYSANRAIADALGETPNLTGLKAVTHICHQLAAKAGWWTNQKTGEPINPLDVFGEKLCLIHSEISEAMEGQRKNLWDDHLPHRKMVEVELADALIRIFDLAGAMNLDLSATVTEKLAYNLSRADHKPENRAKAGGKAF